MKPQLFILENLNGKTYYFTFGVLFSDLSFFPLLKPKFFFFNFILKHFLKLRFFQNSRVFFKTQIFSTLSVFFKKLRCFQNSGCFFSKLRFFSNSVFFFENQVFYRLEQCSCQITAYHDCRLKENEQNGVDDQNGFYLFYASCPFR